MIPLYVAVGWCAVVMGAMWLACRAPRYTARHGLKGAWA